MNQIKTLWAVLCAFFRSEAQLADDYLDKYTEDRYSGIWATAEQVKNADNITVLTPATRRRLKAMAGNRPNKKGKK
jgi:hypothetical protein